MADSAELMTFALAADARGTLMPIEFSKVPFTVRRLFVVTGPLGGATRGEHLVPCAQLLCLIGGEASVRVGPDANSLGLEMRLTHLGQCLLLREGSYVLYTLSDAASSLLVLAEQPYQGTSVE